MWSTTSRRMGLLLALLGLLQIYSHTRQKIGNNIFSAFVFMSVQFINRIFGFVIFNKLDN